MSLDAFTQKIIHYCAATPLQRLYSRAADEAKVTLYLKRDDLIHPQISGNKWRKLKYNLTEAYRQNCRTLLTFGGAYSNHLYAVAAAGKAFGFQTIGLVRGEERLPLNPTLTFAQQCGMRVHYVNRAVYRYKTDPVFLDTLRNQYGDFYLIPEGGSNGLAVKGVAELLAEIEVPWQYLCVPCGTGGTLAGLVAGSKGEGYLVGFSALKGGDFLYEEVQGLLQQYAALAKEDYVLDANWQIQTDYHFGGYAKVKPELVQFIHRFEQENNMLLEQVYTGKMLFGVESLLKRGFFKRGSTVIAIHTGGLQGRMVDRGVAL